MHKGVQSVSIHLLIAVPDPISQELMITLLDAARQMSPIQVEASQAVTQEDLVQRVAKKIDDVVFLDWQLAEAGTPDLAGELMRINPKIRIVVLLPFQLRQYRQCLWETGICSCMPKEHLDQEWLCSVLCLINQSMEREARLATGP